MEDNSQTIILWICFILLGFLGALFFAALFIAPTIAEVLAEMSQGQGQGQLPPIVGRLLVVGKLLAKYWPTIVIAYMTLIAILIGWRLSLRRRS
jgi:hypothetical protein